MEAATAADLTQASEMPPRYITLGPRAIIIKGYILRATPTAAGPSSSKRSVLWRTRGFAPLSFDCCVVVGAVSGMSGACFV